MVDKVSTLTAKYLGLASSSLDPDVATFSGYLALYQSKLKHADVIGERRARAKGTFSTSWVLVSLGFFHDEQNSH